LDDLEDLRDLGQDASIEVVQQDVVPRVLPKHRTALHAHHSHAEETGSVAPADDRAHALQAGELQVGLDRHNAAHIRHALEH